MIQDCGNYYTQNPTSTERLVPVCLTSRPHAYTRPDPSVHDVVDRNVRRTTDERLHGTHVDSTSEIRHSRHTTMEPLVTRVHKITILITRDKLILNAYLN